MVSWQVRSSSGSCFRRFEFWENLLGCHPVYSWCALACLYSARRASVQIFENCDKSPRGGEQEWPVFMQFGEHSFTDSMFWCVLGGRGWSPRSVNACWCFFTSLHCFQCVNGTLETWNLGGPFGPAVTIWRASRPHQSLIIYIIQLNPSLRGSVTKDAPILPGYNNRGSARLAWVLAPGVY